MPLSLTVTPGKRFVAGELVNTGKLNQLGLPTVALQGTLGPAELNATDFSSALAPGAYCYGVDEGSPNVASVTVPETVSAYTDGMALAVKIGFANTGPATLALNALPGQPVLKFGNLPLAAGDWAPGLIALFRYRLDADLVQGALYSAGGSITIPVVAGFTYNWTKGANDTAIQWTDTAGEHTSTISVAIVPSITSVTLLGTPSVPSTATLICPTAFWEMVSATAVPTVNALPLLALTFI